MKIGEPIAGWQLRQVKAFLLLPLLAAACGGGSTSTRPTDLVVWHDPQRKVTCWVWQTTEYNGALSCLPDSSFAEAK